MRLFCCLCPVTVAGCSEVTLPSLEQRVAAPIDASDGDPGRAIDATPAIDAPAESDAQSSSVDADLATADAADAADADAPGSEDSRASSIGPYASA